MKATKNSRTLCLCGALLGIGTAGFEVSGCEVMIYLDYLGRMCASAAEAMEKWFQPITESGVDTTQSLVMVCNMISPFCLQESEAHVLPFFGQLIHSKQLRRLQNLMAKAMKMDIQYLVQSIEMAQMVWNRLHPKFLLWFGCKRSDMLLPNLPLPPKIINNEISPGLHGGEWFGSVFLLEDTFKKFIYANNIT